MRSLDDILTGELLNDFTCIAVYDLHDAPPKGAVIANIHNPVWQLKLRQLELIDSRDNRTALNGKLSASAICGRCVQCHTSFGDYRIV